VLQKAEARADLLEDLAADGGLPLREVQPVQELQRIADGLAGEVRDMDSADGDRQHLRLQARAVTGRARARRHVALQLLLRVLGGSLRVAAAEHLDQALEVRLVAPAAA